MGWESTRRAITVIEIDGGQIKTRGPVIIGCESTRRAISVIGIDRGQSYNRDSREKGENKNLRNNVIAIAGKGNNKSIKKSITFVWIILSLFQAPRLDFPLWLAFLLNFARSSHLCDLSFPLPTGTQPNRSICSPQSSKSMWLPLLIRKVP